MRKTWPRQRIDRTVSATIAVTIAAGLLVLVSGSFVVERLVAERLSACHRVAFNGCHMTYTLTAAVRPTVPGGAMTATVSVRGADQAPAAGIQVTFGYPGQPKAVAKTDSDGRATVTFSQLASQSAIVAQIYVPGPWLSSENLAASSSASVSPETVSFPVPVRPLLGRAGAYSISTAADAEAALANKFDLLHSDSGDVVIDQIAAAGGGLVIDGRLASMLRTTLCKGGGCHRASGAELASIAANTEKIAESPAGRSASTAAWEVLAPDLDGPLRSALAVVHQTLASVGDARPTICSFTLPLARPSDSEGVLAILKEFANASRNFDPTWCQAIAIANVPVAATVSYTSASYDWTLRSTLAPALSILRSEGWAAAKQPLIAMPDLVGWSPRINGDVITYRPRPTASDILSEIGAYCQIGASGMLAYAWDDGARTTAGRPAAELGNTPYLRITTRAAIRHCARTVWKSKLR